MTKKKLPITAILLTLICIPIFLLSACQKEPIEEVPNSSNILENFKQAEVLENDNHKIIIYTLDGKFHVGYNSILFLIQDINDESKHIENAEVKWFPLMHMEHNKHSCPVSEIEKAQDKQTIYSGYIAFQMASNESEYWELAINYSIDGKEFTASKKIDVIFTNKYQTIKSFKGNDSVRYVITLKPFEPIIGVNDLKVILHQMKNSTDFEFVEDYKIKIDPRMPDMGNHSSPFNETLVQNKNEYTGKVNFTMTGYWKINLIVEDMNGIELKGEKIEGDVKSSSLFFDIEF